MYSPPSPVYSQKRATVVKSVNFSNQNPIYVTPPQPEPVQNHCPSVQTHYSAPPVQNHHPGPAVQTHYSGPPVQTRNPEPTTPPVPNGPSSSQGNQGTKPKRKGKKKTRFAPEPDIQKNVHANSVQHEPVPNRHGPIHQEPGDSGPSNQAYRGSVQYYAPSPLPRWEYGTRRQEYFSGEYCYYPTPIREGIYSIATDPHRLTTIFSEENPNACTIV